MPGLIQQTEPLSFLSGQHDFSCHTFVELISNLFPSYHPDPCTNS